jgi:hypothetical protein
MRLLKDEFMRARGFKVIVLMAGLAIKFYKGERK